MAIGQRLSPGLYRGANGGIEHSVNGQLRIPRTGGSGGMVNQPTQPSPTMPKPIQMQPMPQGMPMRPQQPNGPMGHWVDPSGNSVNGIDPGFTLGNHYVPGAGQPMGPQQPNNNWLGILNSYLPGQPQPGADYSDWLQQLGARYQ